MCQIELRDQLRGLPDKSVNVGAKRARSQKTGGIASTHAREAETWKLTLRRVVSVSSVSKLKRLWDRVSGFGFQVQDSGRWSMFQGAAS